MNLYSKTSLSSFLISLLAGSLLTNAKQILIEDFESFPLGEISAQAWPYSFAPTANAPKIVIHKDPTDASNQALFLDSSEVDLVWGDSFISIPIPQDHHIAVDESGTLYFRAYVTGHSNNWYFISSDLEIVDAWADGCSLIEVHENLSGVVKARNATAFNPSNPNFVMNPNTWYEFWVTLNNQSKTYQVSVKAPGDANQTLLTFGSTRSPAFRRNPAGAIQTITIATYNGAPGSENSGDLWLIDDISVITEDPQICDYEVVDDQYINTGDWPGWLDITRYPWSYSWSLSTWIFISSCPGIKGA